jgi:hypothetical protein
LCKLFDILLLSKQHKEKDVHAFIKEPELDDEVLRL